MDLVSVFLSLFGIGQRRGEWISARRAEAYRLTAEVAGDVSKTLGFIEVEKRRLLARCAEISPDDAAVAESCSVTLNKIASDAKKLLAQTDAVKDTVVRLHGAAEWERLIRDLTEWRVTASRLLPWVTGVVGQFDEVLDRHAG